MAPVIIKYWNDSEDAAESIKFKLMQLQIALKIQVIIESSM